MPQGPMVRPRPAESRSLILQPSIPSLVKTKTTLVFISWVRGTEGRACSPSRGPVAQAPVFRGILYSLSPRSLQWGPRLVDSPFLPAPTSQTFHPHHPLHSQALIIPGLTSSSCAQPHPSTSALRINPHGPGWITGERGGNNELLARQVAQGSTFFIFGQGAGKH